MAVFAFNNGRLEDAAQLSGDFHWESDELIRAISEQTLHLVDRALFPVGTVTNESSSLPQQSLIALDSAKRVVTIEVVPTLNSEVLLQATHRAGTFSSLSRQQLACIYPGTEQDFAHRWSMFLEGTSPLSQTTARLYVFCLEVTNDVRQSLSGVDISVKLVIPHQGSSSTLIEVTDVENYSPERLSAPPAPWLIGAPSAEVPAVLSAVLANENGQVAVDDDETGQVLTDTDHTTGEIIDQSLWEIKGWVDRPNIPPLPQRAVKPSRAKVDISALNANQHAQTIEFAENEAIQEDVTVQGQGQAVADDSQHVGSVIKLAELTQPVESPRRYGKRMSRRGRRHGGVENPEQHVIGADMRHNDAEGIVVDRVPSEITSTITDVETKIDNGSQHAPGKVVQADSDAVLYQQLLERAKRAEQRLWDKSAPKHNLDAVIFSEKLSASEAERAVAEAAEHDKTQLAEWITRQRSATNQPTRRSRRSRRR